MMYLSNNRDATRDWNFRKKSYRIVFDLPRPDNDLRLDPEFRRRAQACVYRDELVHVGGQSRP